MSSDWQETTLGKLAEINPRRPISKGEAAPFIEMAALPTHSRDIEKSDIAFKDFSGGGAKFKNGDTLLARITPCLENGKTSLVSGLIDGQCAFGSTEFIVIGPRAPEDKEFLYYLARSESFRSYAISRMEGTSGRQRVPSSAVEGYRLVCPPKSLRAEIGRTLGALDDCIAILRETNATLEAMAQAIFKSWFVDFDPVRAKAEGRQPERMDAEVAALFPDSFEKSELGLVPRGWRVGSLEDIANFLNGLALQKFPPSEESWLPVIKIAQLRKGNTHGADRASSDIKKEYIVHNGDVLFSWSGTLEVEIWCGGKGALNQHLFKVTSKEFPKWFYLFWTRAHLKRFREIAASKATTMGHIQRKHLKEARVVIPPSDVLNEAGKLIGSILDEWLVNAEEIQALTQIRDALLPKLISGEIRLPEAESIISDAVSA